MPKKPQARKGPGKAKTKSRSESESSEKKQSERFIKAARAIGVDESGHEFERTLDAIVHPGRGAKSRRGR
jgi:hypothetical protein